MKILIVIGFFVFASAANAFGLEPKAYNDFEGAIDSKYEIFMSLYPSKDGLIKGNYFYKKYNQKIKLKGHQSGKKVHLEELDNRGSVTAILDGELSSQAGKGDFFIGYWIHLKSGRKLKFDLTLGSIVWSHWNHRYSAMGAESDEFVETFAKKVKKSIIESNYEWLAKNVSYPINISVKGKMTKIETKQSFIDSAPYAFYDRFINTISKYRTMNMFTKYSGAMIGNGAIWMSYVRKDKNEPFILKVIAINNSGYNK